MDLEELRKLAASERAQDRRRAAREAEKSSDLRVVAVLAPLARGDEDPAVRFVAQQALRVFASRVDEVLEELRSIPDLLGVTARGAFPGHDLQTVAPGRASASGAATLDAEDATVRHRACQEIVDRRDKKAVPRLIELLATEMEGWVRAEMAWAIGMLGGGEGAQEALEKLLSDPVSRARANAVEALQLIGATGFQAKAMPLLDDKDRRVRSNAALVLADDHWHKARHVLEELAASRDRLDRMAAIFALQHVAAQKSRPILRSMLKDPDIEIRKRVRGMLGDEA